MRFMVLWGKDKYADEPQARAALTGRRTTNGTRAAGQWRPRAQWEISRAAGAASGEGGGLAA